MLWNGMKKEDSKKGIRRDTDSQATAMQRNAVRKVWHNGNATAPSPMCCVGN